MAKKESRNQHFSVAVTPTLKENIKTLARLNGISTNQLIVSLLENAVNENEETIRQYTAFMEGKKWN